MNLRLRCLLSFLFFAHMAVAETEDEIRAYEKYVDAQFEKAEKDIPKIVGKYATTIGCMFGANSENVVPFRIGDEPGYLTAYSLDLGCSGGSSMSRSYFAFLIKGAAYQIFISPSYSLPEKTSQEFPPQITRLYLKEGEVWFEGVKLQAHDALCCPSGKVSGRIYYENGGWRFHQ